MRVFFDVGANDGYTFLDLASKNTDVIVYAFEPTPHLCNIIKSKIQHLNNYILIEKAVSNFEGKSIFNVAGQANWGCSSLLQFSDKSKTEWPGRTDFVVTDKIEVDVIRLDNFIQQNSVKEIEFLHIDTQGSDLDVLRGLGKYIDIVKHGVIEAANKEDILYIGQNTKDECMNFLQEHGFKIEEMWCNDDLCNEINIRFLK